MADIAAAFGDVKGVTYLVWVSIQFIFCNSFVFVTNLNEMQLEV